MPKIGNREVFKANIKLHVETEIYKSDFSMMDGEPDTITVKVKRKNAHEPLGPHNSVVTVDATWS